MNMKYKRLGDLCDIVSGGTPSRSKTEYWNEGTIPWIKISNIKGKYVNEADEFITQRGLDKSSAKLLAKGTVLYSIFATLGEVGILGIDACTNQAIAGIAIKDVSKLDTDYLYYYLKSKKSYVNNIGRGVAQNNINMSILRSFEVPLPELCKQKEIVAILDMALNIIVTRKQEIKKLDDLIKARFVEMFGDESNPFGWDVVNVEDVATVQVGVVIKPAQYYTDAANGVRAFRSLNIGPMYIKDNDWVYFSEEGNSKNAKSILKENDLIIVRSGAPGTACVVTKEYAGCNAIDIIIAHPNMNKVNPYYLCAYTNLPHGKRQIDEGAGGAAQQHFNVGKYNKLQLMLPPIEKQDEFVLFMEQVDKSKLIEAKSLNLVFSMHLRMQIFSD